MTAAAGGLGIPTKYRLSVTVDDWMLKRARRSAVAATKTNPVAQPRRRSGHKPQVNARIAGARPKETTSASESSSTPNAVDERVSRATNPSNASSTIATPISIAANSKSPRVEYTTDA